MQFDVVRPTKFSTFLLAAFVSAPIAFAQSAQPAPAEQAAPQAQSQRIQQTPQTPAASSPAAPRGQEKDAPFRKMKIVPAPQQKAPQTPDDRLLIKNAQQIPPEVFQQQLEKAMQKAPDQGGSFDHGIYARQTDGANVCGAIVSYNFSSGNNPQLESVTTCTPRNAVTTQRARAPKPKPAGPQVLRTVYQQPEKK